MFSDTSNEIEAVSCLEANTHALTNELGGQSALQALQSDRQRHNSTDEQTSKLFGTVSFLNCAQTGKDDSAKASGIDVGRRAAGSTAHPKDSPNGKSPSSSNEPPENPFDPDKIKKDPEFNRLAEQLKQIEWTGPLVGGTGVHGEDLSVGQYTIMKDGSQVLALHNGDQITIQRDGSYNLRRWDGENSDANPALETSTKNGITTLKYGDGAMVRFNQYGPLEIFQPFVPYSGGGGLHWQREL